jgi:small-conductance mechanosensitive channel
MNSLTSVLTPVQRDGVIAVGLLVLFAIIALALQRVAFIVLTKLALRHEDGVLAAMVRRMRGPSRFIFPLVAILAGVPAASLPAWSKEPTEQILGLCIIAAIAWLVVALVGFAADVAKRQYNLDEADNLHARQVETRLDILSRTAITLVALVAVSAALMTFPAIRAVGATLLASAGLAGLAVGLAARPILENLVAGIQIAFTQPIRIDDVVIVETEYGRIEKITATYVVVRLWDWRRMVLPLTYFIDHPFQNWTYSKAEMIGSVFLYLDYAISVDALREEVPRILKTSPLWDGNVVNVALTDANKEGTVEIRILVSSRNSPDLFDLRCLVREKILAFVRDRYPEALPSTRVEFARPTPDGVAETPSIPEAAGVR